MAAAAPGPFWPAARPLRAPSTRAPPVLAPLTSRGAAHAGVWAAPAAANSALAAADPVPFSWSATPFASFTDGSSLTFTVTCNAPTLLYGYYVRDSRFYVLDSGDSPDYSSCSVTAGGVTYSYTQIGPFSCLPVTITAGFELGGSSTHKYDNEGVGGDYGDAASGTGTILGGSGASCNPDGSRRRLLAVPGPAPHSRSLLAAGARRSLLTTPSGTGGALAPYAAGVNSLLFPSARLGVAVGAPVGGSTTALNLLISLDTGVSWMVVTGCAAPPDACTAGRLRRNRQRVRCRRVPTITVTATNAAFSTVVR